MKCKLQRVTRVHVEGTFKHAPVSPRVSSPIVSSSFTFLPGPSTAFTYRWSRPSHCTVAISVFLFSSFRHRYFSHLRLSHRDTTLGFLIRRVVFPGHLLPFVFLVCVAFPIISIPSATSISTTPARRRLRLPLYPNHIHHAPPPLPPLHSHRPPSPPPQLFPSLKTLEPHQEGWQVI